MPKNFAKLSQNIPRSELSAELFGKVLSAIERERRLRSAKRRLAFFSLLLICSAAASLPLWSSLRQALSQANFWQYLTLLFFDFHATISYGREFSLVLLEILPVFRVTAALGSLLLILISLRAVVLNRDLIAALKNNYSFKPGL